ncbi:alpha/beta fold hydrolase [Kitasatospora sp. NPDC101183]|uniref:alpha/beta fold hydrolase n=1 Tax=Kitasatospora sp. NPDC101183 TaxID=3364100 RepID=UPI00381E7193
MSRLLLLHGLGNNAGLWAAATPHWRPGLEVHAPQLPWSGEGIAGWRHETDSARHVEQALDAVEGGVDVIVAHSFATLPLLELLCRREAAGDPVRAAGVVLVNPFYRQRAEDFHWDEIVPMVGNFPQTVSEGIRLQSGARPIEPALQADIIRKLCVWIGPYGWLRFYDAYLRTPTLPVHLISAPCLVVGTELDTSAPASDARLLAARLPRAESVLLPGVGHFPMLEEPRRFTDLVHAFLDRSPTRSGLAGDARSPV